MRLGCGCGCEEGEAEDEVLPFISFNQMYIVRSRDERSKIALKRARMLSGEVLHWFEKADLLVSTVFGCEWARASFVHSEVGHGHYRASEEAIRRGVRRLSKKTRARKNPGSGSCVAEVPSVKHNYLAVRSYQRSRPPPKPPRPPLSPPPPRSGLGRASSTLMVRSPICEPSRLLFAD